MLVWHRSAHTKDMMGNHRSLGEQEWTLSTRPVVSVQFTSDWLSVCVLCLRHTPSPSTFARTSDSPVHLPPSPFFSLHTATPWWSPLPGLRPNIQHLITNTSLMRGRMEGRREREKEREGERERGSARIQQGIAPQLNRLSNKALSLRGAAY